MGHITRTVAASVAGVVLTAGLAGLAGTALGDETTPDPSAPCAVRTAQVTKAEAALARVTAVFEKKQAVVDEATDDLAAATTPREQAAARKALHQAQVAEAKAAKVKKAQQMRLKKAQHRLETCLAGQPTGDPTADPTDSPTVDPTADPTDTTTGTPVPDPSVTVAP